MRLPKALVYPFFIALVIFVGGLVSASPASVVESNAVGSLDGTPTLQEAGSPVGPRRNGFSDLPLLLSQYNRQEPMNQIPDYIMGTNVRTDPNGLNGAVERDSLLYSANEVFQALSQGYEVLQRARDPQNRGRLVMYGNIGYPNQIDMLRYNIAGTDLGRFTYINVGSFYTWPLTWAGTWNGHNQNPGDDRVVFNQDGVYLGVLTRRTDAARLDGAGSADYRWCAATNNVGAWLPVWMGANRGWDYPGQPPDGEGEGAESYQRPDRWLTAAAQRTLWYKYHPGVPPFSGGSRLEIDPDTYLPISSFDESIYGNASNPLDWPPEDNSTGTWRTFVPPTPNVTAGLNSPVDINHTIGSDTFNSTIGSMASQWRNDTQWLNEIGLSNNTVTNGLYGPGDPAHGDCLYAKAHTQRYYWQSCQAAFTNNQLQYRVTIAGSGQATENWCPSLLSWVVALCGNWANELDHSYSCDQEYKGTLAWLADDHAAWPDAGVFAYGIDLHFTFNYPWCPGDANHQCVSGAVAAASCGAQGLTPINGIWCRDVAYVNNSEVEYGQDFGTPAGSC